MSFTGVNGASAARGGPAHRFVGPVVLLEDLLRTILAAICKHHYHLIAVGPRGAALLGEDGGDGDRRRRVR